jgi:NAD(P)H-dependent FMN reductase
MELNIALIYGSVRTERQGIKAARFLNKELKKRNYEVSFIDPLEYDLPMLDYMYKEYKPGTAPADMEKIANMLKAADAFLIVTGEYNHGFPPAMKNILDHFQAEYLFKPSAIASYSAGQFGGVRSAIQMRIILGELGTPAISSLLPFPKVQDLFDDEGKLQNERFIARTNRFLDELEFYAKALKKQRDQGVPF